MTEFPEGNAIIYCEGAFQTANGKTAHGLVRRTDRYRVTTVIDSCSKGFDAGELLDRKKNGILICGTLEEALGHSKQLGRNATHLVIGLAPDGGRLPQTARPVVLAALEAGISVDSGLHDFLSDDQVFSEMAKRSGAIIRDIRKPPHKDSLHFFSGKVEQVEAYRIAILGTDSAIGKRTTAWILRDALNKLGKKVELIGTGQTAWLQGVRFGIVLDSLINDFVSGEIEHAIWKAFDESRPEFMLLEGQGSLLNPAYPGGFELLAAGRPQIVILQHAPARKEYDGFPGYKLHGLTHQIQAIEMISGKQVAAITINHEGLSISERKQATRAIESETGLPAWDVLEDGADALADLLISKKATS